MRIGTPLLAAALLCPVTCIFPADSATASPPTISSFEQLWRAERIPAPTPYPVRMEVVVLYHDAAWKAMWARCGDTTNYLSFTELIPQTQPGQRILIEGHLQPQNGSWIAAPRITTLAPPEPLTPIDATGKMDQPGSLHANLITVSGLVDRQTDRDLAHLCLDIVAEGRLVTIWLPHDSATPVPQMEKAIVRATGVFCATATPDGQFTKLELCVQSPADIAITGWIDRDERFAAPLIPIQDLATTPTGRLAHVAGIVRATQPGVSVTLRDDTGQITVLTQQAHGLQLGEPLEAVGYPHTAGAEWQLRQSLFRRAQQALPAARGLPRLRLATQLRELPAGSAGQGYPVQLSGVVTWSHPDSDSFFILDTSGGACVRRPDTQQGTPAVGDKVDVVGVSEVGDFAPVVAATGVYRAGNMDLPSARPVTLEQALTGVEEAQWVAMSGFVRDIAVSGPWARLEIGTAAGPFMAVLPKNAPLAGLRGAVIRLRGVCAAVANDKRQLDSIALWVPDTSCISIVDPCPADPFSVPEQSIASLRQFGSQLSFNHRVRICAHVVGQLPGRMLHVQDGADSLLVLSRDATPLQPGDRIEAVGFPGRESFRVVLHEAVFRKIDHTTEPAPLALAGMRPVDAEADGRLVCVEGSLLEVSPQEGGTRLTVQNNTGLFEAVIDRPKTDLPASWLPGSRIALTGVYEVQLDEYRRPSSAHLFLRMPADVVIRQPAPWWTSGRALAATGILALGALGGFAWVVALRRRVQEQTELIRTQFEKEKAARMETTLVRTSKLESLGLLAGGIAHDFNNLLTVISCNLSLLRLGQKLDPETEQIIADSTRASLRARDLTLQLLTFAKGGQPVLSAVSLPEVVRESGEFARHGSSVRCLYDFAGDLWPAQADKGQIGQVVHNLVLNAIQAMPDGGVIIISLRNSELPARSVADLEPGRYIQLTVADNGRGIPADALPRVFEPYFTTKSTGNGLGLATVHSIVRKHQGQIEVESAPGKGTTFTLWLPAADDHAKPAPAVLPTEAPPRLAGRILFLDDEQPIRQTAALLFKRLGLESITVEDGAAALREYSAARAAGQPFTAVILDLTIPGGMGGAETMARLREIDPQVCGIVSSGYSDDPVLANYRAHGFSAIIRKPYEADEVAAVLAQVLPSRVPQRSEERGERGDSRP